MPDSKLPPSRLDAEAVTRLTGRFNLEDQQLHQLELELEKVQTRRATDAAEAATVAAKASEAKLAELLTMQASADREKADDRKFWKRVIGVVISAAAGTGGWGGYQVVNGPAEAAAAAAAVEAAVEKRLDGVETRQVAYGSRFGRLADMHYDQVDLTLATTERLERKLDRILGRMRLLDAADAEEIRKPEAGVTIDDARDALEDYEDLMKSKDRKDRRRKDLRDRGERGDPFAGLPEIEPVGEHDRD